MANFSQTAVCNNLSTANTLNQLADTPDTHTSNTSNQSGSVDFDAINERAIDHIEDVISWLDLEGNLVGKEFKFLNPKRDDAELGSCSVNIEKPIWYDFSSQEGGDYINLVAHVKGIGPKDAATQLVRFLDSPERTPTVNTAVQPASLRHPVKRDSTDELIVPVSANAPALPPSFGNLGKPTMVHTYRNADGQVLCYIYRYELADGKKVFCPLTLRRTNSGLCWMSKGLPEPKPLYGLDRLAARPDAPVLFVEGEKKADAAKALFPEHVVVTTMNGAVSAHKADLEPLLGRDVLIWADHDEPGRQYADTIAKMLRYQNSEAPIRLMKPIRFTPGLDAQGQPMLETGFEPPKGWDVADAAEMGWTAQHIALLGDDAYEQLPSTNRSEGQVQQAGVPGQVGMPPEVKKFLARCFPDGLIYTNATFLGYECGYWRRLDELPEVGKKIAFHFGQDLEKAKDIRNLLELLKNLVAEREIDVAPNKTLICLENGTLDTNTYQVIEHSPKYWLQTKIPAPWKADATCERWLQFLHEIFRDDPDRQQKIGFVQEWFGYCLTPDASQHKFVWMVGAGGNGKSVLLNVLTYLVGRNNVSHAYMERLDRGCVRAELEGKLVNISSEMSADATIADGYFKAIVSGDIVEAERKFKPSFSFRPYVRLIGATNHLPRLLDLSDGFFRRAIILTFNRQFAAHEQDAGLEDKLRAELPGILVWSMEGLQNLRTRGKFDIPVSSVVALNQYRQEADPIGLFVEDCLEPVEIRGLRSGDIYEGYSKWCKANGYSPKNHSGFGKRLKELGFQSYRTSNGSNWKVSAKEGNGYIWCETEVLDGRLNLVEVSPGRYQL
ncbi:MAG: hypothetical protein HYU74_05815 [Dechloromonas sp.]|nr:hypothetical protein [Dechloromonas sp.]